MDPSRQTETTSPIRPSTSLSGTGHGSKVSHRHRLKTAVEDCIPGTRVDEQGWLERDADPSSPAVQR